MRHWLGTLPSTWRTSFAAELEFFADATKDGGPDRVDPPVLVRHRVEGLNGCLLPEGDERYFETA